MNLKDLQHDKCYCNQCLKEEILTELEFDKENKIYRIPNCKHKKGSNFYILIWLELYNNFVIIRGRDPNKLPEFEKSKLRTKAGDCSLCGKYNNVRDNESRGKDNTIWVNKKEESCGCDCSKQWYYKHNNSDKMIQASKNNAKILYQNNIKNICSGKCKRCGNQTDKRDIFGICKLCRVKNGKEMAKINTKPGYCKTCGKFSKIRNATGQCGNCCGSSKPGNCKICNKFSEIRNSSGMCIECSIKLIKSYKIKKYCEVCNQMTSHNGNLCLKCHPPSYNNIGNKFCTICNKETFHNGSKCTVCHPKSRGFINLPSFKKENNFCCKIHKNEKLQYYNKLESNYICWSCYKEKFDSIHNNEFANNIINLYKNAKLINTFRDQNSNDWSNAHSAFEQNLLDNNIHWFVYIKFYINAEGNIEPIVVGKTGSLFVNHNGSDVNFSENINDGPARRFLSDNKLSWDKTQILMIPTKFEGEAYKLELKIKNDYNLFES